jgi:hypothetical protein
MSLERSVEDAAQLAANSVSPARVRSPGPRLITPLSGEPTRCVGRGKIFAWGPIRAGTRDSGRIDKIEIDLEGIALEMTSRLVNRHFDGESGSFDERERENVAEPADGIRVPPSQEKIGRSGLDCGQGFLDGVDKDGDSRVHPGEGRNLSTVGHPAPPDSKECRLCSSESVDRGRSIITRDDRQLPTTDSLFRERQDPSRTGDVGWCNSSPVLTCQR